LIKNLPNGEKKLNNILLQIGKVLWTLVELQWFVPSVVWLTKFSFKTKLSPTEALQKLRGDQGKRKYKGRRRKRRKDVLVFFRH